jgi:ABC-type amino acid transport substrate-binding protein
MEVSMRRFLTLLVLSCVFTVPAFGQELQGTLRKIKDSGTIVLGHRDSSIPFSFVAADQKPAGYSVDLCLRIATAIQQQLGLRDLQIKWVLVTPENRIASVVSGTIDLECGSTTNTLSRQEQVDFTHMTFVDGGGLLVTKASRIQSVGDLGGKAVAVIPGTTTEKMLGEALRRSLVITRVFPVKDHAEGLAALEGGNVDAYASDRVLLMGLALKAKNPERLAIPDEHFSYEPYGFMLRRGDADFRLAANRALSSLYRSGQIRPIFEKWFGALGRPTSLLLAMYALHSLPE